MEPLGPSGHPEESRRGRRFFGKDVLRYRTWKWGFLVDSAALSGFAESARWSLIPEDLLCAFELVGRVALAHGSGSG